MTDIYKDLSDSVDVIEKRLQTVETLLAFSDDLIRKIVMSPMPPHPGTTAKYHAQVEVNDISRYWEYRQAYDQAAGFAPSGPNTLPNSTSSPDTPAEVPRSDAAPTPQQHMPLSESPAPEPIGSDPVPPPVPSE